MSTSQELLFENYQNNQSQNVLSIQKEFRDMWNTIVLSLPIFWFTLFTQNSVQIYALFVKEEMYSCLALNPTS